MASIEIASALLNIEPTAEIRADIRDWTSDPGPTWQGMAMHGTWLHIESLCYSLPHDPAARLAVLERLADAVETLVVDARAQMPVEDAADVSFGEPTVEMPEPTCPSCGGPADLENRTGRCADCEAVA